MPKNLEKVRSSSRPTFSSLVRPFSRGKRSASVDVNRLPSAEQPSRLSLNTPAENQANFDETPIVYGAPATEEFYEFADEYEALFDEKKWKANTSSVPPRPIVPIHFQEGEIKNEQDQPVQESLPKVVKERRPKPPLPTPSKKKEDGERLASMNMEKGDKKESLPKVEKPTARRGNFARAEKNQDHLRASENDIMPKLAKEGELASGASDLGFELGFETLGLVNKKELIPKNLLPTEKSPSRRPKAVSEVESLKQEKLPHVVKPVPRPIKVTKVGAPISVIAKGARTLPSPAMSSMPPIA